MPHKTLQVYEQVHLFSVVKILFVMCFISKDAGNCKYIKSWTARAKGIFFYS